MVRLISFYLPQYHPIPENDLWWGKGFTEWTNVSKAVPLFEGHYQPHLPADLGFYDLRLPEVREQQVELANHYGIYGFCYYYYWFNGRRLLEKPSRNWDGKPSEILMPQEHTKETDERFILDLLPILGDERYIRVNGRPLVLIYRTELLPDIARTSLIWRELAFRHGIDLYLCRVESFARQDPANINFDAACEFPPNISGVLPKKHSLVSFYLDQTERFEGILYDYENLVDIMMYRVEPRYKRFPGVAPSWDNTPRSGNRASVFLNSSPDSFRHWLTTAIRRASLYFEGEERIVFINAWNEWAEGCHLEPDRRYGHALLQACKTALGASCDNEGASATISSWEASVPFTVV
jgi:lipopolysaccharide biosynthesis protein